MKDCPCHSGFRYAACCAPFHKSVREAPTPEALMRSRYAAFALGLGEYLVRTLSSDHPDRAKNELALALSRVKDTQRFLGLRIVETSENGDEGMVHFHARIFEHGMDRSFEETSSFRRESGAWKYSGAVVSREAP